MEFLQRITNIFKSLSIEPKDLSDKHILITGGSEGIGLQTAQELAKMGAKITIASRNAKKCEQAVQQIKKVSNNNDIQFFTLDLASFSNIKESIKDFISKTDKLDILINNAGGWFHDYGLTEDNLERSIQVNHLGPLLLTLELIPIIKETSNARIIFLSSDLHNEVNLTLPEDLHTNSNGYNVEKIYGKTKLMNVMVVNQLAKKLSSKGTIVCSLHPGFVATNIGYTNLPNTWSGYFSSIFLSLMHKLFARTIEQGSITSIYVAINESIKSGEYYDSCAVGSMNPIAKDKALTEKLWSESLNLIGVNENNLFD